MRNLQIVQGIFIRRIGWILAIVILLLIGSSLMTYAQTGGGYDLTWWTVDDGGATGISGGNYTLFSTVGQPDAADAVNGGSYTLSSGFWPGEQQSVISGDVYLPIILRTSVGTADLIGSFALNPNQTSYSPTDAVQITAVITNVGTGAAGAFWVDFYINPSRVPQVNDRWDAICGITPCKGIAWFVSGGLGAGQSIILTSTPGSYSGPHTNWPGTFESGVNTLYMYADSWNPPVSTGGVVEINEGNNLSQLSGFTVSGLGILTAPALPPDMPPRPLP